MLCTQHLHAQAQYGMGIAQTHTNTHTHTHAWTYTHTHTLSGGTCCLPWQTSLVVQLHILSLLQLWLFAHPSFGMLSTASWMSAMLLIALTCRRLLAASFFRSSERQCLASLSPGLCRPGSIHSPDANLQLSKPPGQQCRPAWGNGSGH